MASRKASSKRSPSAAPALSRPPLTARQQAVMDYIKQSIEQRGYAPAMREIAAKVKLSSASSVKHHLDKLEHLGYLRRDPLLPRAMEIVNLDADVPQRLRRLSEEEQAKPRLVPLVGRIAAGTPILAEQMVDGLYPFPREVVGSGEVFALKVHGDSMIEAGILDGDLVVVRHQVSAENGQIVAALVDGEATVKVWMKKNNQIQLLPRNPAYQPIPGAKAQILGRVVAVVRSL